MQPVDRADVDHARRVGRGRRLLELREQRPRQVEDGLHVERQHLVPGGVRILGEGRAPVGAGVVDQHVQRRLARPRSPAPGARPPPRCATSAGIAMQVPSFESSAAACVAGFDVARRDVDPRAGLDEAARDHQPDAARAPRDERHLARDREEILHDAPPLAPTGATGTCAALTAPVASSHARRITKLRSSLKTNGTPIVW